MQFFRHIWPESLTSASVYDNKRTQTGGRYANPKLDTLLDRVNRELDMNARDALIRQALMIVRDDLAVIPLFQIVHAWAMRSNIEAPFVPNSLPYFYRFRIN